MRKKEEDTTAIGGGSHWEGRLHVTGPLLIEGLFEGELRTENTVQIAESGKAKTNISAKSVTIGGVLIGNINSEEKIHLLKSARVLGDLTAPIVQLEEGAVVHGQIYLGKKPEEAKQMIEEAYRQNP